MTLASTQARIDGYEITPYKGTIQGEIWGEFLRNAVKAGAKAFLNTCYDHALDIETQFHSVGVVVLSVKSSRWERRNPLIANKSSLLRSKR